MNDITELFIKLIDEHDSIDIAEDVFKKSLVDDRELKAGYAEWCHAVGSSEKRGFRDWAEEYVDSRHSMYESLSDYDDE